MVKDAAHSTSRSDTSQPSLKHAHAHLKDEFELVMAATVLPSEENVVMLCKSNRILTMPLTGNVIAH